MRQNSNLSETKTSVIVNLGDKTFTIKLLPYSIRDDYKKYLVSATYTKKGETKSLKQTSQKNYLEKLEQFIYNELEPLDIAEKFDIYRVDSVEVLECLCKTMNDKKNQLYKISHNNHRTKKGKPNPCHDISIADYLGGDPYYSLKYYIKFLKERLR